MCATRRAVNQCQRCGALGPTKSVTIPTSIGLLIAVRMSTARGNWCRRCIDAELGKATLTTGLFGWWSIIGLILTPAFLALNLATFLRTRGLPAPDAIGGGAAGAPPMGAAPIPEDPRAGLWLKLGVATIPIVVGVALMAFFAYTYATGTDPRDQQNSPMCLACSFVACVLPGVVGAGYALYRAYGSK